MPDPAHETRSVRPYTFFDERRPARWWMPTLEMVNYRFAQHLRTSLLQYLQPPVDVVPEFVIELIEHVALIDRTPTPSYLTIVRLKPLQGTALLIVDAGLVSTIVESRFGGTGRFPPAQPNREFTPIEHHSMSRIVGRILEQLVPAWQPIAQFEPEVVRNEIKAAAVTIANATDLIVVSNFTIKVANGSGTLAIAIPSLHLEPLHERLVSNSVERPAVREPGWSEALQIGVGRAVTVLDVEFTGIEMTVQEFLDLQPGNVVAIERPATVTVRSCGVPLFDASWGRHGRKLAVRVEDWMQPATDEAPRQKQDRQ
jgi:flagellar motor switch protein FliM